MILKTWNATDKNYPYTCFHELFEQQAKKTPNRAAVSYKGETLTYRELDEKAHSWPCICRRMERDRIAWQESMWIDRWK